MQPAAVSVIVGPHLPDAPLLKPDKQPLARHVSRATRLDGQFLHKRLPDISHRNLELCSHVLDHAIEPGHTVVDR
jgi:hypothetical protein